MMSIAKSYLTLFYLSLFVGGFLISCREHQDQQATLNYLSHEIKNRQLTLNHYVILGDTMRDVVLALDSKISSLILLSKDIENLNASVSMANTYFQDITEHYHLQEPDFTQLHLQMHMDEIAIILKQNELTLLNQLIFKYTSESNTLFTAH